MTDALTFTVHGAAQPAGSKRAFKHARTGAVIVTDANKKSRPWKQEVRNVAATAMLSHGHTNGGVLVDGPLRVDMTFYVPRPKGHYGVKGLRPSAPVYPTTRPDVLKLARGVEDALTGVVYRDDAQIVVESLRKQYGEPARVEVVVTPLDGDDDPVLPEAYPTMAALQREARTGVREYKKP
jgi:Holliday junction resolvase RusA-like endonuclease